MKVLALGVLIAVMLLIAGCAQQAPEENKTPEQDVSQPPPPPPQAPPIAPPIKPPANETQKNVTAGNDMFSDDLDQALRDLEAVE